VRDEPRAERLRGALERSTVELAEETTQVHPETAAGDEAARQAGMDDAREVGTKEMSQKFRDLGGQVYVEAAELTK
jgi:phosphomethylpyrimidine synthase